MHAPLTTSPQPPTHLEARQAAVSCQRRQPLAQRRHGVHDLRQAVAGPGVLAAPHLLCPRAGGGEGHGAAGRGCLGGSAGRGWGRHAGAGASAQPRQPRRPPAQPSSQARLPAEHAERVDVGGGGQQVAFQQLARHVAAGRGWGGVRRRRRGCRGGEGPPWGQRGALQQLPRRVAAAGRGWGGVRRRRRGCRGGEGPPGLAHPPAAAATPAPSPLPPAPASRPQAPRT